MNSLAASASRLPRFPRRQFKYLTVNHVYYPLANSDGKLLVLLRALKAKGGDSAKKLFQFLNNIGARALRMQLGRVLEMAQSSPNSAAYERRIVERFGGQKSFEFPEPIPANASQPPSEQSPTALLREISRPSLSAPASRLFRARFWRWLGLLNLPRRNPRGHNGRLYGVGRAFLALGSLGHGGSISWI